MMAFTWEPFLLQVMVFWVVTPCSDVVD